MGSGDGGRGVEVVDCWTEISNGSAGSKLGGRVILYEEEDLLGECSIMGNFDGVRDSMTPSGNGMSESTRFRSSERGNNCSGWSGSVLNCKIAN